MSDKNKYLICRDNNRTVDEIKIKRVRLLVKKEKRTKWSVRQIKIQMMQIKWNEPK